MQKQNDYSPESPIKSGMTTMNGNSYPHIFSPSNIRHPCIPHPVRDDKNNGCHSHLSYCYSRVGGNPVQIIAFTLIEILVALVILAIALLAGVKVIGQSANSEINSQQQTEATWVAKQIASESQLDQLDFSSSSNQQGNIQMLGQSWSWRAIATPAQYGGLQVQATAVNKENKRAHAVVNVFIQKEGQDNEK